MEIIRILQLNVCGPAESNGHRVYAQFFFLNLYWWAFEGGVSMTISAQCFCVRVVKIHLLWHFNLTCPMLVTLSVRHKLCFARSLLAVCPCLLVGRFRSFCFVLKIWHWLCICLHHLRLWSTLLLFPFVCLCQLTCHLFVPMSVWQ